MSTDIATKADLTWRLIGAPASAQVKIVTWNTGVLVALAGILVAALK